MNYFPLSMYFNQLLLLLYLLLCNDMLIVVFIIKFNNKILIHLMMCAIFQRTVTSYQ